MFCPRLLWDLSVTDFPITWIEKNLESLGSQFLKTWSGLVKCADPNRLYLPKQFGGIKLSSIVTTYKKLKCAKVWL